MQPLAWTLERNATSLRSAPAWSADNCGSPRTAAIPGESGDAAKAVLGCFAGELDELGQDIRLAAREYRSVDEAKAAGLLGRLLPARPA